MPGSQPNTNILSARTAGAVFAIVAILVCADLWLCDGHLVYTLDDPYISLGLGWHIWHGHYGVNATEFSSPSSSILYPFLLALFGWSDLQIWAPLIINTAAAVATAALFAAMSARYGISTKGSATWRSSLLLVVLCLAWHREIAAYITEATPRAIVGMAVLLLLSTAPYLRGTLLSPRAGLGIYDQQYQMRRFVVDYYRRPVAVNDLGWVSYRNPNYVLDLWGLASEAARKKRLLDPTPGWPETLTRAHEVGLAIIYETWFEGAIPAIWQPLARLEGAHHLVIGGGNFVTFYATSPAAAPAALDALHRFSATLPANVATLTVTDSASNTVAVAKSR